MKDTALALAYRHHLFRTTLEAPDSSWPSAESANEIDGKKLREWVVRTSGGYFAFVRHPFERIRAEELCRRIARDVGVLMLPATFFAPTALPTIQTDGNSSGCATQENPDNDHDRSLAKLVRELERWLRVSVANVDDAQIIAVAKRMRAFSTSPEAL